MGRRSASVPASPAVAGRWQRIASPLATSAGLTAATVALHLRDPHVQNSWGFCPSAALGLWCPGCGGLRAVNDLTHRDVEAALSSNLMVTVAIPFAVLAIGLWGLDRWRGADARARYARLHRSAPWVGPILVALVVAFVVARNLAFGAWLAP